MKDDLEYFEYERRPKKTLKMEDYLNLFENGRQPQTKKITKDNQK